MSMNRVALVTGAGRGIGRAIALKLAGAGWDVAVNYRTSAAGAEEIASNIIILGRRAIAVQADVADAQAVLPRMLHEKEGNIINVTSIWGLHGASCEVAYAATKAALVGLTKSLAAELAPSGIRVNAVAPGCIDSDMLRALGKDTVASLAQETPLGRIGTAEDVAKVVRFLAAADSDFITGQILTADGGFTL